MKHSILGLAMGLLVAALASAPATPPAMAQEGAGEGAYAANSQARSWNLAGEEKARFEAKIVDVLCELSGDCAENCGDGRRQLGVVRKNDGALLLANKNTQPIFSGAVVDLLPYCGADVEIDGLLVGDGHGAKFLQIQLIRRIGEAEFAKTNLFSRDWNAKNPELAEADGPWFRKDPRVNGHIETNGYFGLGLEVDEAWIREEFGE